jgi:hypothetical protein
MVVLTFLHIQSDPVIPLRMTRRLVNEKVGNFCILLKTGGKFFLDLLKEEKVTNKAKNRDDLRSCVKA